MKATDSTDVKICSTISSASINGRIQCYVEVGCGVEAKSLVSGENGLAEKLGICKTKGKQPVKEKAAAGYAYGRGARDVVGGFGDFDPMLGVVDELLSDGDAASSGACSVVGGVLGKLSVQSGEEEEVDSHGTKRIKNL